MGNGVSSISVIVPCYNYAHFLRGCVESILSQPGVQISVLVIDDASTDNTQEIGVSLAAEDARVQFRRHLVNRGHIATYNEGLEWADGDYTVLLSADDLLAPGALERAARLMDDHPSVGMVYGGFLPFRTDRPLPAARTGAYGWTIWPGQDWLAIRCERGYNSISSPEVTVRTALVRKLGGYREELPHSGDLEMWMRFAAYADVGYLRRVDQAYYRIHPESMLRQRYYQALVDLRERRAAFDVLFRDHGDVIPDRARLQDMANRALAREALWRACRAYDRGRLATVPVTELVDFAIGAHPDADHLGEYAGLRWRQRLGPRLCPFLQPVLIPAALHRIRTWLTWRSIRRHGI